VAVGSARETFLVTVRRAGLRLSIAGLALLGANASLQNAVADGDTETLSFHHVHTGEDLTVTFKRDGHYDEAALNKLDWFMRDWRKEKATHMDPHLFDLLWQVYHDVGATQPIQIICGYRSPSTNAMLHRRTRGVARFSEHINGQAIDFFIPGVPLAKIREEGLKLQLGGVGFYPTSGSPFVHMDTGLVRHWPRIARKELVKIFPHGRTVHIPSDGRPLRHYALALGDIERRGNAPNERSLQAARAAGVITEHQERVAELVGEHQPEYQKEHPSLLAKLFGSPKVADANDVQPDSAASENPPKPVLVASAMPPPKPKPVSIQRIVPLPPARPKALELAAAKAKPAAQPMQTASLSSPPIDKRGDWPDAPADGQMLPAPIATGTAFETASLDPVAADNGVLAYASTGEMPAAHRTRPMGSRLPHMPAEARVIPASVNAKLLVKTPPAAAMTISGQRINSPWLRAAMLTPSVSTYMTATRLGRSDLRPLHGLLDKPQSSLLMTFSADPQLGMVTDRFSGHAVVFLATTSFPARTASLQ
jgi:uncharacterized protein YcbK (DUF882 family)